MIFLIPLGLLIFALVYHNCTKSYVGTICTTIVGQPLLLMTTGFLLIGGCIGIFGRLLSKN